MDQLTEQQLQEWVAYNELEPMGQEWRRDFNTAQICSTVINTIQEVTHAVHGKKGSRPPKPVDPVKLLPRWDPEERKPKKQGVDQMKKILQGITKAAGGRFVKRGKDGHRNSEGPSDRRHESVEEDHGSGGRRNS